MLRTLSTPKLSASLIFAFAGTLVLAVSLLHAGRTLLSISAAKTDPIVPSASPVEQTITKALELVSSQTSSD